MISDEQLDALALQECTHKFDDGDSYIDRSMIGAWKLGYRAAEQAIEQGWPSHEQICAKIEEMYQGEGTTLDNLRTLEGWLKSKVIPKKPTEVKRDNAINDESFDISEQEFVEVYQNRLELIKRAVEFQAKDQALWFVSNVHFTNDGREIDMPITASEDYLQQSLRDLHRVIDSNDTAALQRIIQRVEE